MTQVFIAAPTPMMRAGLRALLESEDLQVVGEAPSLTEINRHLGDVDVLLATDAILLEDDARAVVGEGELALVVLSDTDRPASLLRSLPLRGWGIVQHEAPASELRAAVLSAAQGLIVFSLPLAERLLGGQVAVQTLNSAQLEEQLTAREREVLELLSQGLSNKLIARQLNISEHTVKFHVSAIYTKLGAASRTEAVSLGARLGIISF